MAFPQLVDGKTLGGLGCPQFRATRRVGDVALVVNAFDRVGHRGRCNHSLSFENRLRTTVKQGGIRQTTGPVVNQHVGSPLRQARQSPQHRLLASPPPLNPLQWF